jgi:hypothetical protein
MPSINDISIKDPPPIETHLVPSLSMSRSYTSSPPMRLHGM